MVSEVAVADIEEMRAEGLNPSVRDIIRLNALALKMQAAKKKSPATSLDYLPRVAAISDKIAFRQPTIGHEIWLDKVERMFAPTYQTALAIKAYALSRGVDDLPDAENPESVRVAVETFAATCADFTRDQIYAALDYAIYGSSALVGEHAEPPPEDEDDKSIPDVTEDEDWKECVAVGVLHEGHVALFGMSRADMEKMTRRQLEDAIRRAYIFHHLDTTDAAKNRMDGYYATREAIRERLVKERETSRTTKTPATVTDVPPVPVVPEPPTPTQNSN